MKDRVVEDAVDGDSGANAEGEREDRGNSEAWVPENLPEGKAEILEQYLHQRLLAGREE
jgi:hypothetical protein